MKIAIGSKNPVKIDTVREAFEKVWPNKSFTYEGIDVKSGVSDQPMSDIESIKGATTRAKLSMERLQADFAVGLEGGLQQVAGKWFETGWVVVIDKNGVHGIGSSIRLETPPKVMKLINSGVELGVVCDILFKQVNSKHKNGYFGLMTNNTITRQTGYRDGVISALTIFLQPEIFSNK